MSIKNTKKDFLKLLARTSVVAMTALSAGNAVAANVAIDGGTANLQTGANTDKGGILQNNDTLIFTSHRRIEYQATPGLALGGLNINQLNASTRAIAVTAAADGAEIGSIGNVTDPAHRIKLELADNGAAYTFHLNGATAADAAAVGANDYSGLGAIAIGNNAKLNIKAPGEITLNGTINAINNDNNGELVTNASKVNFNGVIGATKTLKSITTNAGEVVFGDVVKATTIVTNAGEVSFGGHVTGNVHLSDDASVINIADGLIITGQIDNETTNKNKGTINFAGSGTVTAAAGTTDQGFADINLNAAGIVEFQDILQTDNITFAVAGANLNLTGKTTVYSNIVSAHGGTIQINNDLALTVIGDVGTIGNRLTAIELQGAKTLTLASGGDVYTNITTTAHNSGKFIVNGADLTLHGDIGFHDAADAMNNMYLDEVSIDSGDSLILNGSAYTANGIKLNNAGATLQIGKDGAYVNKVQGEGADQGIVEINAGTADAPVQLGRVGAGNAIAKLQVNNNMHLKLTDDVNTDTTGIFFDGGGTIVVDAGKTLNFANGAKIDMAGNNQGTLILNGQEIDTTIGGPRRNMHLLRAASGHVKLNKAIGIQDLQIGQNAVVEANGAAADLFIGGAITPYALPADNKSAKFIVNGHDIDVGDGVGAITEVNFKTDNTLSVQQASVAGFSPVAVTTDAANQGKINLTSNANFETPTNFSTMDGDRLAKLTFEFTQNADAVVGLKGTVINATEINLTSPAHANTYALNLGLRDGNTKYKPQIIIGDVKGTNGGGSKINANIAGHTFIEGNVGAGIDNVNFTSADKRLYLTGDITGGVEYTEDGQLYLFAGNQDIDNDVDVPVGTKGCIVARGLDANSAKAEFLAGNTKFNIDTKTYTDTLKLGGVIGVTGKLQMIDIGKGTLEFDNKGGVSVNKINAKTVVFKRAGAVYDIGTLMDSNSGGNVEEVDIKANSIFAANSTLLGTQADPLKIMLNASLGAKNITLRDNVNIHVEEAGVAQFSGKGHTLILEGNTKSWSALGTELSKFQQIQITPTAEGKTVTLYKDVNTTNGILLTDNAAKIATTVLHGNVDGGIKAGAADNGTVTLAGSDKAIDFIGVLGGGNAVGVVNVNTDKAKVTGAFHTNTVNFKQDGVLTLQHTAEIDNLAFANSGDTGTIVIEGGDFVPGASFGQADVRLKAVRMGENTNKITLANNKNHNTLIQARINAVGEVNFAGVSNSPNLDLGESTKILSNVEFGGAVTFRDGYASDFNANAQAVTFRKATGTTNLTAGGSADVTEGGYIYAKGDGNGTVNILGSAEIAGVGANGHAIAALNVNANNSVVKLSANEVHSTAFSHKNSTINTKAGVRVVGAYTNESATLGTKGKFEVAGNTTLGKAFALNDMSKGIALDLQNSAVINIAGLTSTAITLDARRGSNVADGRVVLTYNVAHENKAGNAFKTFLDKTTITSNDPFFADVRLEAIGKNAILKTQFTGDAFVNDLAGLSDGNKEGLKQIFTANKANTALLQDIGLAADPRASAQAFGNTEASEAVSKEVVGALMNEVSDISTGRIATAMGIGSVGSVS